MTHNTIISACAATGDVPTATTIFSRMLETGKPAAQAATQAVPQRQRLPSAPDPGGPGRRRRPRMFCRGSHTDLPGMPCAAGCAPTERTFGALLNVHAKAGDVEAATRIFKSMEVRLFFALICRAAL